MIILKESKSIDWSYGKENSKRSLSNPYLYLEYNGEEISTTKALSLVSTKDKTKLQKILAYTPDTEYEGKSIFRGVGGTLTVK